MILKNIKDAVQGKAPLGHKRSSHWPTVRKHFLEVPGNNKCAACGGTDKIEVHHKEPFHLNPDLELDPNNFISLCESNSYGIVCHLTIGHLGNYKNFNPNVVEDAANILKKLTEANK